MIKFYHETGTILHFAEIVSTRSKLLGEVVLFNPHWLLKALACFLYEVETHGTKRFQHPKRANEVNAYEEDAIMSQTLLKDFWKNYSETEKSFLMALLLDSLLASAYEFVLPSGDGTKGIHYMIPGMLTKQSENLVAALPPLDQQLSMSLKFSHSIPKGVYERIICIFLNKSGAIEGSKRPAVFVDIACFFFRDAILYIIPSDEGLRIVIDKAWKSWIAEIRDIAMGCCNTISSFFYEKSLTSVLFLHGGSNHESLCEVDAVRKALSERK